MSSALVAALFAILGTGLAATSAACVALWRRVRALAPGPTSSGNPADPGGPTPRTIALPKAPPRMGDERARRVDELAGRLEGLETRLAKLEAAGATTTIAPPSTGSKRRRFDAGTPVAPGGPTLISVPDLAAPPASTSGVAAELDRRFGPVWAMADEGAPVAAITRETGYPIGQVELILGLRRRLLVAEALADA